MNPTDSTGKLRAEIRDELDSEYPNGSSFTDDDLKEILENVSDE